jgi:iron complex outermembrane recepter protein
VLCSYNFNAVAAEDASSDASSLMVQGDYQINDAWMLELQAAVNRNESFGRYAPVPGEVFVAEGSPGDPVPGDGRGAFVQHRFAPLGPRDTSMDENQYDLGLALHGQVTDSVQLNAGLRRVHTQAYELGRNYLVRPLAEAAIANGTYDLRDPFAASAETLSSIKATVNRDAHFRSDEAFASMDLFSIGDRASTMVIGGEWRREDYADLYDSLSTAGVIEGSAGNSAAGDRSIRALYGEWRLPIAQKWAAELAVRHDDYSDLGDALSSRISVNYQALEKLGFRAAFGESFAAARMIDMYGLPSFSSQNVVDLRTCEAYGRNDCFNGPLVQVPGVQLSNPELRFEESQQFSLGLRSDPFDWLKISADYYDLEMRNAVRFFTVQGIVDLDNAGFLLPAGLAVDRDPITGAILGVTSGAANLGGWDLRGLDVQLQTQFDFAGAGRLQSTWQISKLLDYSFGSFDTSGFPGSPKWRSQLRHDWALGDFSLNWTTHYISSQVNHFFLSPGIPSYTTHDVQLGWQTPWKGSLSLGAQNVGDRYPSLASAASGNTYNRALYDAFGRTTYMRYTQSF